MLARYLSGIGILIVLTIIAVAAQVRPEQVNRGAEWLAWSPGERSTYVYGFISGYQEGTREACDTAERLFGDLKTYNLGDEHHPSDMPSARCLALVEEYSNFKYTEALGLDFTSYTNVITEFYTKHPEYQGIPFGNLLELLSDRNPKTADQLYQMALKGELRPLR
jgi:hypothetical protein